MKQTDYDIIIIGAGCAGMQLLYALVNHSNFNHQRILIIDDGHSANQNKSWCSWVQSGHYDYTQLISKQWNLLGIGANGTTRTKSIDPYSYTYINSQTFFDYHYSYFKPFTSLQFITDHVTNIVTSGDTVTITTEHDTFTCTKVYNSQFKSADITLNSSTYIHQQFHGLFIETENKVFNTEAAVLMDFIGNQQNAVTFMYVLPFTANKALLEITRFTSSLNINHEADEMILQDYIKNQYKTNFQIISKESGVLPMTDYRFRRENSNSVIPIGIAAGMMKPSTGYAFNRIHRHSKLLSNAYYHNTISIHNKERFFFYDKLLLKLIELNPQKASAALQCLFKRVPMSRILRFLDEDSSLKDEIALFLQLPKSDFIRLLPSIAYR
jgi:lycopene beta-cyclase